MWGGGGKSHGGAGCLTDVLHALVAQPKGDKRVVVPASPKKKKRKEKATSGCVHVQHACVGATLYFDFVSFFDRF